MLSTLIVILEQFTYTTRATQRHTYYQNAAATDAETDTYKDQDLSLGTHRLGMHILFHLLVVVASCVSIGQQSLLSHLQKPLTSIDIFMTKQIGLHFSYL